VTYRIDIAPGAAKALRKLDRQWRARVSGAIELLALEPRPPAATMLRGGTRLWRVRVGDYRVIYQVQDDRLVVLVLRLGHRREVYDR
jgi:mRNA interferase RelE/StbE